MVALAAAATVLLLLLHRLTSRIAAWILALAFTAIEAQWRHTFGEAAILACLYAMDLSTGPRFRLLPYWMAGLCAAAAMTFQAANMALLPALALALVWQGAPWLLWAQVFLLPGLAAYFVPPVLPQGLLPGPGTGFLVFIPAALVALAAFAPRSRKAREQHQPLVIAAASFSMFYMLLEVYRGGAWLPREILGPLAVLVALGLPVQPSDAKKSQVSRAQRSQR